MAIFGLILLSIFWIGTTQRGNAELAEAQSSEFSKNANLALALDVQTNQLLTGIDHFLLLIKDQYEGAADYCDERHSRQRGHGTIDRGPGERLLGEAVYGRRVIEGRVRSCDRIVKLAGMMTLAGRCVEFISRQASVPVSIDQTVR